MNERWPRGKRINQSSESPMKPPDEAENHTPCTIRNPQPVLPAPNLGDGAQFPLHTPSIQFRQTISNEPNRPGVPHVRAADEAPKAAGAWKGHGVAAIELRPARGQSCVSTTNEHR